MGLGRAGRLGVTVIATVGIIASQATAAQAYDRTKAVSYANAYWNKRPTNFPNFSNDCTNFVSQAVFKGGVAMRFPGGGPPPGAYNNSNYWYASGTLD